MTDDERQMLQADAGVLRPVHPSAQPLPWRSIDHYHKAELARAAPFEWTEEREQALFSLIEDGYSLARVCNQGGDEWPTQAEVRARAVQDPAFKQRLKQAKSRSAESMLEVAGMVAESSRGATAAADRVRVDYAFRMAGLLDNRWNPKNQVDVSGGLVLAAGSLAELAAQAAASVTPFAKGDTLGITSATSAPDNVGRSDDDKLFE